MCCICQTAYNSWVNWPGAPTFKFALCVLPVALLLRMSLPRFRLDDLDAAEPRPRRPVSALPFQVISVVVRPENQMPAYSPIHCRFRAPLPGPFTPLASSCPRTRGVGGASFPMPRIAVRQPAGSLRCLSSGQEGEERRRLALSSLGLVTCVERESSVLLELQGYSSEQLLFLFTDRAPTTLKRHLSGWRRCAEYCFGCNVAMGAPACTSALNFLEALAEGSQSNCGKRRSQAASGVVHAVRFVAHKLGLQSFACTLHGPIVGAWLAAGK